MKMFTLVDHFRLPAMKFRQYLDLRLFDVDGKNSKNILPNGGS